jgi:hypothetical protein
MPVARCRACQPSPLPPGRWGFFYADLGTGSTSRFTMRPLGNATVILDHLCAAIVVATHGFGFVSV